MPSASDDLKQRLIRPLIWSILAAVVIYGGSVVVSDVNTVGKSISKLSVAGWTGVLVLSLLNYGLRYARWEIYLRHFQYRIPPIQSLAYYIAGFAFTTTPGKAGEAVRSLYLKSHNVSYIHSLAAFFSERFVDLVAMVLLTLTAILASPDQQLPVLMLTLFLISAMPLVHSKRFHLFLDNSFHRIQSQKLRSICYRFLELLRSSADLLRSGPLVAGVVIALAAWGAEGVALYIILQSLEIHTTIGLAVGIYSISILVGALSFIPGGLGSTEAVMILLLKLVGADTPTAVAACLICRLTTLWFAVILGGTSLFALEVNAKAARQHT
ncbi:MAG: lysylphosphatidylglycerol synthase transmembrane domain-containing protein [Candidatus Thiodiazotropha sp.]